MSASHKGSHVEVPLRNLRFPNANVTAIELLTFLPGCLSSPDIIYRFASNLVTWDAILSVVNTNRVLKKAWDSEYCYRTARNAMRHAGHGDWTLNKHSQYFGETLRNWNTDNLSVSGFRTSFRTSATSIPDDDIPFVRLADGVKNMPQGDDALDLTRMIQHCIQNPAEDWMYPSNYDILLEHLGGAKQLSAANLDRPTFVRWQHVIPHVPRSRKRTEMKPQPKMRAPGLSSTPQAEAQATRRSGRRGRPSLKKRELQEGDMSEAEASDAEVQDEEYVPGPTFWIKPLTTGGIMSSQALQYVFEAEPSPDAVNKFDAYAFGNGPRTTAPFRPLHLVIVDKLKFDDLSGWAENIRWAAEQYATFGETGWTECPEHMEQIAQIRQEQTWASAELVIAITDKKKAEEEDEAWVAAMMEGTMASMNRSEPDQRMWIWGDVAEEYVDAEGTSRMRIRPWPRR
ncbi:uncharacterized protein N0V89_005337 [Didymosphaeria variabile]|uniref:Uncharacterized protein n=1 Tax=Didymosphaeria variabile TaxID=1932322 RepID=A0A9W8XKK8_9PLEO|nr:uncharacterized protein N0V89_005337 [Didymosphaeria variabile]KAJ4353607.1 hypothetical protein N0V89_005337 [Didymosphaeria variabile]